MACPGKWKHGPIPAGPWWLMFDPYPWLGLSLADLHLPGFEHVAYIQPFGAQCSEHSFKEAVQSTRCAAVASVATETF